MVEDFLEDSIKKQIHKIIVTTRHSLTVFTVMKEPFRKTNYMHSVTHPLLIKEGE